MPVIFHALAETLFEVALCVAIGFGVAEVMINLKTVQAALAGRLGRDR